MRYIFDRMAKKSGEGEIMRVMDAAIETSAAEAKITGVEPLSGYSFEDKRLILPLQSAELYIESLLRKFKEKTKRE